MDMIRKLFRFRRGLGTTLGMVVLASISGCQKSEPPPPVVTVDSTAIKPRVEPSPWAILYSYSPIGLEIRSMGQMAGDTVWAGREITFAHMPEPVVLANTGIGLANAAATTQFIIDRYKPVGIIFCGISSPINPAHQIGDLMIPESFVTFDHGYWGDQGFQTDSVTIGNSDSAGFQRRFEIPVDPDLFEQLGKAAEQAAFRLRAVLRRLPEIHRGGIGISGNAFVDNKARREQLSKQLRAQITDTESAAVVQTAHSAGVPVVVIRACAAPAGESAKPQAQAALADFFKVAAHNIALVIQQFFEM